MPKMSPVDLIKPVPPGMSWTDPEKGRPWSQPPKVVDIAEVAQLYIDNLSSSSTLNSVLDAIDTEVPLASLAEGLMLTGVMKGQHTMDAGILVMPVIIEMLKTVADIHGAKNLTFADDLTEEDLRLPDRVVKKALDSVKNPVKEETPSVNSMPSVKGLMSRKSKEVV